MTISVSKKGTIDFDSIDEINNKFFEFESGKVFQIRVKNNLILIRKHKKENKTKWTTFDNLFWFASSIDMFKSWYYFNRIKYLPFLTSEEEALYYAKTNKVFKKINQIYAKQQARGIRI